MSDLEFAEAAKRATLEELKKHRTNLNWLIKNFERPEFEDIYRMKQNGNKFEFAPVSVQKMLLKIINEEITGDASILINIDIVIDRLKEKMKQE